MDFGLDQLCRAALPSAAAGRIGVLAHAASVDRRMRHIVEVLRGEGLELSLLFAPEHGFAGGAQDMAAIADERSGDLTIVSLYGDELDDLVPRKEQLDSLDLLIIDLNDVGSRYYTFVWTALLASRAAIDCGVHVAICDRPNPIGGQTCEGATQLAGYTSFVGWEPVPIRHGMTLAELVLSHLDAPVGALSVLPVRDWQRGNYADAWDRPFVLPSPNMPTVDTAVVYPGGCLIEGTNMSEGRGHTRPFEFVGAPWTDGRRLARELNALGLSGFTARPVEFIPTFHKHAGDVCGGVQIHVTDRSVFRPVATYVALIALAHHHAPDSFRFRTERYEFVDDIPAFDLLTGSAAAREAILAGDDARAIAEAVSKSDAGWRERIEDAQERVRVAASR